MAILLFIFAIALQKSLAEEKHDTITESIITALTDIAGFWKNLEQHRLPIERFLIFAIGVMKVSDVAKPE